MKAVRKSILATSLLAVLPGLSQALGLGGIDVKSGLNEPLVAEIQVIMAAPDEREGLSVGLARPEDFANVGLDYSRMSMPLDFAITTNAKGDTIIRVTSQDVVREPFLSLLLEVNWAKGRLLREYSLLLDPPVMASVRRGSTALTQPVVDPVVAPPESLPTQAEPVYEPAPVATADPVYSEPDPVHTEPEPAYVEPAQPAPEPEPVAAEPSPAPPAFIAAVDSPSTAVAAPSGSASEYGPVAAGENLYAIAQRVRADTGVSVDQLMVSILRMNPQAFYQDNINALKSGAILRIPAGHELVSVEEARSAVQEHNQLWTGYQARSSVNPALVSDSGSASVAGSTRPFTSTADRLEVVAPGTRDGQGGADRPNGQADAASAQQLRKARDDLALTKEELSSARREAGELGSRVQELERLQGDQARLIGLKDDRIAELERRLKDMEAAERKAAQAAGQTPIAAQPVVTPITPEPVLTQPDPVPVVSSDPVASTTTSEPAATGSDITREDIWGQSMADPQEPATTDDPFAAEPIDSEPTVVEPAQPEPTVTAIAEPATPAPVAITPTPAVEPGFLELYWPWLAGGGGVLVLLGLLAVLRKKKPVVDDSSQPADDGYHADEHLSASLGFPGARQPASGGIPTPPPFEAFDADPEMALRSGIEADPDDLQCHLELLRLFYRKRDADAFEDAAQAMLARLSDPALSPEWQEARAMGEALVPNSSLFARLSDFDTLDLPAVGAGSDDGLGDLDFGSFDTPAPAPAPAPSLNKGFAAQSEEPMAFDFNLDLDAPTKQVEPVRVDSPPPAAAAPAAPADDLSFDFNLDLDSNTDLSPPAPAPAYAAPAPAPAPASSFEPSTLDLPDFDFDSDIKPVERMSFEPTEIASPIVTSQTSDLSEPEIIREPELPAFDDALFSSDDAVGTKLDLARAYLDMGDPDGARSMLEEVMAEGDDVQRNEARELLGRLG